jgi:RNA polymerase sigma factor (sigma-70 family)
VIAFAKGVLRNRAKHVNRDAALWVPVSEDDIASSRSCDAWFRDPVLRQRLQVALWQLTPRERQVVILHWVDGHSAPSVARQLGVAVRTVKELLRRARSKLGNELRSLRPPTTCAVHLP